MPLVTAPVVGLRRTTLGFGITAALVKLNMFVKGPAMLSKEPPPMRWLERKTSSMKRVIELWSVTVESTAFFLAQGEITRKG